MSATTKHQEISLTLTLTKAKGHINDHGLAKGVYEAANCEVCTTGALLKVCDVSMHLPSAISTFLRESDAVAALYDALPANYKDLLYHGNKRNAVQQFNDNATTTKERVLALFDRAILLLDLREARRIQAEGGYVRGTFKDEHDCHCVMGSVNEVYTGIPYASSDRYISVRDALNDALPAKYKAAEDKSGALYRFNDDTNQEFVLALFDSAIRKVQENA